jgi:hypothetical protein
LTQPLAEALFQHAQQDVGITSRRAADDEAQRLVRPGPLRPHGWGGDQAEA